MSTVSPPKRFYQQVTLDEATGGNAVLLDGRILRTPAGHPLSVGSAGLAQALAAEWEVQGDHIDPQTMPLTRLVNTALDRVSVHREAIIDDLVSYGGSDLLCYRAVAPQDLVQRQEQIWQPLLDWAAMSLGVELAVTSGIVPLPQPPASLARARQIVGGYDDFRLAALHAAVAPLGSLVLGLALAARHLTVRAAFEASRLDEAYQSEFWGEDADMVSRRLALQSDIAAADRLLDFCRS